MRTLRRLVLAGLLPVLLMSAPGPAGAQETTTEDELFSTAQRAFDDGFHDVAVRYLEQFLPQYPQSPKANQARLLLGQCYFLSNDYNKALDMFRSVRGDENKDMLLFWLGETYLKLSDYPRARENYQQLLDKFPDSVYIPQSLYSLAWSYFDHKEYAKAGDIFQKLAAQFPKHQLAEDASLKAADCIYNLGDYRRAIAEFEKYMAVYPQTAHAGEIYLNIADAYYYMEDFTQSMAAYEKAIKASSDPAQVQTAYIGRIWCAIKKKSYDQGRKWIKEAMDLSKSKSLPAEDLLLAQGQLLYEQGDWDAAVNAYTDLISQFPSGARRLEGYLGRANAYYLLKKFPEAAEDFKFILEHSRPGPDAEIIEKAGLGMGWTYVKLNSIDEAVRSFRSVLARTAREDTKVNALVQIADAYQDAGRFDEAVRAYDNALKDHPKNPWEDYVQYRQAIAFLKQDKTDPALDGFQRLQKDFPDSKYLEDINYYMGVIEFKKGDWGIAASRMEDFLKGLTHPSDFSPEANYILALSYLNLKQPEEALKIFQKILRLYPDDDAVAKNADIGIAKCESELGQAKEAVKRFKIIVYKYPRTDVEQEALLWLAQYAMKSSQYDQAVDNYNQILEHFPDTTQADEVHYELGQAYEALGNLDQALTSYKAVSARDPALLSKVKLAIAGIFSKEFDPQKALSAYQNIAATDPDYARDAYLKMAQLYRNTQDYQREIEVYGKALKLDQGRSASGNAELLFDIADANEAMGRVEEAVDYYLKVPAQYPDQSAWVVKAYLRVAKIFEDRQDWEGARVTYRKIMQLKTEESKYAQERLDALKKKGNVPF